MKNKTLEDYVPTLYRLREIAAAEFAEIVNSKDHFFTSELITDGEWARTAPSYEVAIALRGEIAASIIHHNFGCLELHDHVTDDLAERMEDILRTNPLADDVVEEVVEAEQAKLEQVKPKQYDAEVEKLTVQ